MSTQSMGTGLPRPPSEEFDKAIDELTAEYAATGNFIAAVVAAAAVSSAPTASASETVRGALVALLAVMGGWLSLWVPRVYLRGVQQASRSIEGEKDAEETRQMARETLSNGEHKEAIEAAAETLGQDLQGAVEGMYRDSTRALGEIRRARVQEALSKGSPLVPVENFALDMGERGISFVDRSGRQWKPETYAQMVLRTNVAQILNTGHLNKALELGSVYVKVSDGGPGDVDEPCVKANGQVWHIVYAAAHLLEHPNCRRSFAALDPDYTGSVDKGPEDLEVAA